MNSILAERINHIESLEALHLKYLTEMMQADSGKIFGVDLLAQAAFKRSMSLCAGFACLVKSKNYLSAATLVRLQLDTCLRFFAAFIVEHPHDFAQSILMGVPVRNLKDRSGQLMTDRYLVETLGKQYDWMPRVYTATSGFIHLSERHMFSVWQPSAEGELMIVIGPTDDQLEDDLWIELADAFLACTDALFEYLKSWIFTKQNPGLVAEVMRQQKV
ncbi:hypothetical protein ACN4EG_04290 [Alkalinema pantanalense CENA528]|uniref:hypothetical protein n=1 Tax=Alkalinema pantanalense TaxID=1620705 RepID=UPI003D6F9D14